MPKYVKSILLLATGAFVVPSIAMDNETLAAMLATRAKNDVMSTSSTPGIGVHGDIKTRANRGSAIAVNNQEAECGGVAIGNIRYLLGDHREHKVIIVINGNIINSDNNC